MPEGDTITRAARALDAELTGRTITRFTAARLAAALPRPGTMVEGVEARGKHLLVRFDDGRTLHTHMQMTGSWHVYRPGERWRKPRSRARVILEVDSGTVAVCFSAPIVELLRADAADRPGLGGSGRRGLAALGPDLCRPDADLDEALRRMDALAPDVEVADVLLDQRVAAGLGNVYKSEVCFALGLEPGTSIGALDADARRGLLETASRLLRANLDTPRRTTVAGGLAVYGRAGRPCRRCGTTIRRRRQGPYARSTYWCPTCQHVQHEAALPPRNERPRQAGT